MPQQPSLKSGQDVTALMSGADVTDLMTGPKSLTIAPGTAPAEAIAQMKAYNAEQGIGASPESSSWLDSVLSYGKGVAEQLNPIEMVKGLYGAVTSPWDTAKGLTRAQIDQFKKGKQAFDEGRYAEAYGHTVAGALPLVGPAGANVGETIGTGKVAEGLGQATGLLGSVVLPSAVRGTSKAVSAVAKSTGAAEQGATMAERLAQHKFVEAVAPQVGANKVRFGNMAAEAAPQVLREPGMGALSRAGLAEKVGQKLEAAEADLDTAADARNAGRAFASQPIIKALEEKKRALMAEAVEGSEATPKISTVALDLSKLTDAERRALPASQKTAEAIGSDVVPVHNRTRVAQIDEAIREIKTLGSQVRYESLRRIRQSFDQAAKIKYSPSMTADFLAKSGEASGASDVTSVLRDHLGRMDPATAAANKPYALWRKMDDVLHAAEETDRVRPKVGRKLAARFAGAMVGGEAAGTTGALLGAVLAPLADSAMIGSPTTKILTARALTQLADALRKGDAAVAESTLKRLRALSLVGQTRPKDQ